MAANLFGRYVWLIEQFRRYGSLTYEAVNDLWHRSGLSYGESDDLALRTFHNHRKAIADIFDVDIVCDVHNGYTYHINDPESLENDSLRLWLIDSYSAMNLIQVDQKLNGRILFEDNPSGRKWLEGFIVAMRNDHVMHITYQGFDKSGPSDFDIEPYCLKVVKRRWYVLARSPYYSERNHTHNLSDGGHRPEDVFLIYSLDRIIECRETSHTFVMKKDFDCEAYFRDYCGIITSPATSLEHIVFRAYGVEAEYLRTLPLHTSQQEISSDEKSVIFSIDVKPTLDFYQLFLSKGDHIEILRPDHVRHEMKNIVNTMVGFYNKVSDEAL